MSYLLGLLLGHSITSYLAALLVVVALVWRLRQPKLPPGPAGWPYIGNLFLLLNTDKKAVFRSLRRQYGDLVNLKVGHQHILLVSGLDSLRKVFVDRGKEFIARPQVFTTLKLGQGKGVVNSSGAEWREHRAFMVSNLSDLGVGKSKFQQNVLDEVKAFLQVLQGSEGEDFDPKWSIMTAASNIICAISFGKRFEYHDEDFRKMLQIFEHNMSISGSTTIVNYFPFLEYFPGDFFKCREVLDNVDKVQVILKKWIERGQKTPDTEKPRDMIDRYFKEMNNKRLIRKDTTMDEAQLLKFVGDLLVAGTETTATTIRWGLIFLVRNPEVMRKMREEIQTTLGGRSHLWLEDKPAMPYTSATMLEIQRLGDIAPLSLPHSNPRSVVLDDYVIPAGSVVLPNLNSVLLDPEVWPDPTEFKPERFLDDQGDVVSRKEFLPFSLGPRTCPGASLAKMEVFLILTSIVHHFDILPSGSGLPAMDGHFGITYIPLPHELRFVRRNTDMSW